jgi:glycosyltransferase involved in cell wall biosynthesis
VAPNNYNILAAREDLQHIGGAEVQRALIARELVRRGYEVSFVTWDHGQPDGVVQDGIRVFKMCEPKAGLPGLRFLHPRWTSLWAAMARADADLYYQRAAGAESGQVALWTRRRGRRFVYALAVDAECDPRSLRRWPRRERQLFLYALRRADAIVAQTNVQRRMLAQSFALDARVIRSCAPEPESVDGAETAPQRIAGRRVLWIGRPIDRKRPDMVEHIARLCPDCNFDVVGLAPRSGAGRPPDGIVARLAAAPNVTVHGFVPHTRIGNLYQRAALLICTSLWEGFPNTFLEAWSRGIPVVSTVDPDDLIRSCGLGGVATSAEEMQRAIGPLLASPERWQECSARARQRYLAHHTPQMAGDAYESLFEDLGVTRP